MSPSRKVSFAVDPMEMMRSVAMAATCVFVSLHERGLFADVAARIGSDHGFCREVYLLITDETLKFAASIHAGVKPRTIEQVGDLVVALAQQKGACS